MLDTIIHWLKIGVLLVIGFVVISLFMDNAASWGANVGGFFSSIETFLKNLLSTSPLS